MTRDLWDEEAPTFDDAPDHGLRDPRTRSAWRRLLLGVLPPSPAHVADLGCGTGTLTHLLSAEGFVVDGLDYSAEMLRRARAKVPTATFVQGDAATPALEEASYDAVLARHVLWAMPDPVAAFARWVALLKPGGLVVLVEGRWGTGAGLTAAEAARIVRTARAEASTHPLLDPVYWGKVVDDERYLLVSAR